MNFHDLARQCTNELEDLERGHDPNLVKIGEDVPLLEKWSHCIAGYFSHYETQVQTELRQELYTQIKHTIHSYRNSEKDSIEELKHQFDTAASIVLSLVNPNGIR